MFCDFSMTFLSANKFVNVPLNSSKHKNYNFCWHFEGHWRKEQDLDPLVRGTDPDPYQSVTDPEHWYSVTDIDILENLMQRTWH